MQRFISWPMNGPRSWFSQVRLVPRYRRLACPVITVMSCRWHSPPSSQTGQSCGWFSMSHSMTDLRKSSAWGASMEKRMPSRTEVMQAMTRRPRVSSSSAYSMAAHWRHAPTEPIAGMPAEVGQVEVVREHGLEEVLSLLDRVALPVDDDVCHGRYLVPMPTRFTGPVLYGQPPRSMCASKSARKYFSALDSGSMAPAACRQNVLPGAPM